jgi:hypothetical protein
MIRINTSLLFALALVVFCATETRANTITATSCSAAAVQTAINSASSGDTVRVPGGTCSWDTSSNRVTIPSTKNITLDGQGTTTINWTGSGTDPGANTTVLTIAAGTTTNTFITGFTFNGAFINGRCPITFNTSFSPLTKAFRFYKNTLTYSSGSAATMICINGNGPGLFDHNTFTTSQGASELIHNYGEGSGNTTSWSEDVVPGGPNAIYLEDNTFSYTPGGNFYGTSAIQNYFGSRVVFRYNTLHQMQFDVHGDHPGTCGTVNGRWWEVYGNTFHTDAANVNQSNFIVVRGGSGVIFNNHHPSGEWNEGTGNFSLTNDCGSGIFPLLGQVGWGMNQQASPVYIWGNDSNIPVGSGSSYVQLNRDFLVSSTQPSNLTRCQSSGDLSAGCPVAYNYVPYQYPHPLTTGGTTTGSAPAPPTGLVAIIQ